MAENLQTIPIRLIDEPRFLLRPVLRQSKEFLELRSSIEKHGLISAVLVRPKGDRYELVAGNWRRTACVELQRETIPCVVRELNDQEVLALQLQENAVRFETKPAEFANQLKRLMDNNPAMSFTELAALVSKHPNWIKNLLHLPKLDKQTQLLLDRGAMPVMNAVMLAKMPGQWRGQHVDDACRMTAAEFRPLAASIIKRYMECIKQGKLDARYSEEFKPVCYCRKPKDIQAELDDPTVLPLLIVSENCKTLLDAALVAARWAIHLDRESVEAQRHKAARQGRLESEGVDGLDE